MPNVIVIAGPAANSWRVFDVSTKIPEEIARFSEAEGESIFDEGQWKKIKR